MLNGRDVKRGSVWILYRNAPANWQDGGSADQQAVCASGV